MLLYLVLNGPYAVVTRDELLALFWPDLPESRARNALTQSLSFLRRELCNPLVRSVGRQGLSIDASMIDCDVVDLETALRAGDKVTAVKLYTGRLLPAFHVDGAPEFEFWLSLRQRKLHDEVLHSSLQLIDDAIKDGDLRTALSQSVHAFAFEPSSDALARRLIAMRLQTGDRAGALRDFELHAAALRESLDESPDPSLLELLNSENRDVFVGMQEATPVDRAILPVELKPVHQVGQRGWTSARWRAAAIATISIAGLLGYRMKRPQAMEPSAQFDLVLPDSIPLRTDVPQRLVAIDPGGRRIAYVGGDKRDQIYIRTIDNPTPTPLPGTFRARNPMFVNGGRSLTYWRDRTAYLLDLEQKHTQVLADSVNRYSLGADGSMVFEVPGSMRRNGLMRSASPGGRRVELTKLDDSRGEILHTWPHLLPDASAALFVISFAQSDETELALVRLSDGKVFHLGVSGHNPRFIAPNLILFGRRDGTLRGMEIDLATYRVGKVVTLLSDVAVSGAGETQLDISNNGTVVYLRTARSRRAILYDVRNGSRRSLTAARAITQARISPLGTHLAFAESTPTGSSIRVLEVGSGREFVLTANGDSPEWSNDGATITWRTQNGARTEVWSRRLDMRSQPTLLTSNATLALLPDDSTAVFYQDWRSTPRSTWTAVRISNSQRVPIVSQRGTYPAVSSDGRLLASVHEGAIEVRQLSIDGAITRIEDSAATDPAWSGSSELLFRSGSKIMRVSVEPRSLQFSEPRIVADSVFRESRGATRLYGVMPKSGELLLLESVHSDQHPIVVTNGLQWMKQRLSSDGKERGKVIARAGR